MEALEGARADVSTCAELASIAQRYQGYGHVLACIEDPEAGLGMQRLKPYDGEQNWKTRIADAGRRVGAALR